jgi:hypothetical protein
VVRAAEVAAHRHAERVRAVARASERTPNREFAPSATTRKRAGTGSVTPSLAVHDRAGDEPAVDERLHGLGPGQSVAPPSRPVGDHLVEVAPAHHVAVGGKSGWSGHSSSSVTPCAIERRPSNRW